jgi:hypothetical protein
MPVTDERGADTIKDTSHVYAERRRSNLILNRRAFSDEFVEVTLNTFMLLSLRPTAEATVVFKAAFAVSLTWVVALKENDTSTDAVSKVVGGCVGE